MLKEALEELWNNGCCRCPNNKTQWLFNYGYAVMKYGKQTICYRLGERVGDEGSVRGGPGRKGLGIGRN